MPWDAAVHRPKHSGGEGGGAMQRIWCWQRAACMYGGIADDGQIPVPCSRKSTRCIFNTVMYVIYIISVIIKRHFRTVPLPSNTNRCGAVPLALGAPLQQRLTSHNVCRLYNRGSQNLCYCDVKFVCCFVQVC